MRLIAFVLLGLFVGCGDPPPVGPTGTIAFQYHLLDFADSFFDATSLLSCETTSGAVVAKIRILAGNDDNADGVLDDAEVLFSAEDDCNYIDANGDGVIDATELGTFGPVSVPAPLETNLGSVEFLDEAGIPILARTADDAFADKTRLVFNIGNGLDVGIDEAVTIFFGSTVPPGLVDGELQGMFR